MNTRILAAVAALAISQAAFAEQNLTRKATVSPQAAVDVSNVQGFVRVSAWDRNEVELVARLESDKDTLEFEASEDRVRIKVQRPKGDRHWSNKDDAELTLRVPQGARLQVQTISADIDVTGVKGEQRLETVSGDVNAEAHDSNLSLRTVSGKSVIEGKGARADVTLSTVSGDHKVRNIGGSFDGTSVSGRLEVNLKSAERVKAKSVSGDIKASLGASPGLRLQSESISGDINVVLAGPVGAEFEVESFSGSIDSCFKAQPQPRSKYGPGRELRFTEGDGKGNIRIKSMSGDIRVCDR